MRPEAAQRRGMDRGKGQGRGVPREAVMEQGLLADSAEQNPQGTGKPVA